MHKRGRRCIDMAENGTGEKNTRQPITDYSIIFLIEKFLTIGVLPLHIH